MGRENSDFSTSEAVSPNSDDQNLSWMSVLNGLKAEVNLGLLVTDKTIQIVVSGIKQHERPEVENQLLWPNTQYNEPMSQLLTEQTPWTLRGFQHSHPKNSAERPAELKNLQKYLELEKYLWGALSRTTYLVQGNSQNLSPTVSTYQNIHIS